MIVAVIDLGKTNSKVALVDTNNAQELQVVTQAAVVNIDSLYPCIDHVSIGNFITESLRALAQQQPIDAITVTTHGATAALLDANGELSLPVLDYEYKEVDETRNEYNSYRPSFSATGSPALPAGLNIGAQLFWLQKKYPTQFSTVKTVLTWPQYWVHFLTGEKHNDVTSLGCHTDLYEPRTQRYSTLVDAMNWQSLMPQTKHSGDLSGTVLASIAQATGLSSDTPVYTGIHDSNASLVPHLFAQTRPFTVVSTGTWFIAMSIGGKELALDETRDTLLNVNAHGDAVPSARFMGGRERDQLGVTKPSSDHTLDTLLSNHSPTILLPSVVTDTGPYPDHSSKWLNPVDDASIKDCAATLYLALMTNQCMRLIGSDGPTYIEGPLAHDRHYAQMLAAVTGRHVFISHSQTGTSVGAAMLVSKPKTQPHYSQISTKKDTHLKMQSYATLWRTHLHSS